jgi:hypothetical protein
VERIVSDNGRDCCSLNKRNDCYRKKRIVTDNGKERYIMKKIVRNVKECYRYVGTGTYIPVIERMVTNKLNGLLLQIIERIATDNGKECHK